MSQNKHLFRTRRVYSESRRGLNKLPYSRIKKRLYSAFAVSFALLLLMAAKVFASEPAAGSEVHDIFQPIEISGGFNQDVIFEDGGEASEGVDNVYNNISEPNAFYSFPGVDGSLPEGGLIRGIGNNYNNIFLKLGSYQMNNVLKLDGDEPSGILTFKNPKEYSSLAFMATGGDGGGTLTVTAYSQDNIKLVSWNQVMVPDWLVEDDSNPAPLYICERCQYRTGDPNNNDNSEKFGIYTILESLPDRAQGKEIKKIKFEFKEPDSGKPTICIFGVSGIEKSQTPVAIFDSNGGCCDTFSLHPDSDGKIKMPAATSQSRGFERWENTATGKIYHTGDEVPLASNIRGSGYYIRAEGQWRRLDTDWRKAAPLYPAPGNGEK